MKRILLLTLGLVAGVGALSHAVAPAQPALIKVPVVTESLRRGDIVLPQHVELKEYDARRVNNSIILSPEDLVGMEVVRSLRPDTFVFTSAVRIPPVVARKKPVNITVQSGNLSLRTKGKALEDGLNGDMVQVMNINSNKILYATVVGPNTVEVQ